MLIHSVAGAKRGGHSHNCPETVMLLTGKMRYSKVDVLGDRPDLSNPIKTLLHEGESSMNSRGVSHMGEFLEDTWLIERKLGVEAHSAIDTDYEPFRKHQSDLTSLRLTIG